MSDCPQLGLLRFGDKQPTAIPASSTTSLSVRIKALRMDGRALRIRRAWQRKHGRTMTHSEALGDALWQITNLHGRREWAERGEEGAYEFVHFGLAGPAPRGKRLSDWCTAFAVCIRRCDA